MEKAIKMLIGHGEFRYRIDAAWSKADPQRTPVRDCHEMVATDDGRLFLLTNCPQNNVLVYDTDGHLLNSWTLGFEEAHGLSVFGSSLYITNTDAGVVVKTSLDGTVEMQLPHPHACGAYGPSDAYCPTETAVAPNGDIYVADGYGSQHVLRFDSVGRYLGKFGGKGAQPIRTGKFLQVHGVAIDTRGDVPLVVCTERIRNELVWFTLDGEYVKTVYLPGAYLSRPVIAGRHLYSAVCFGIYPDDFRMWQNRGFVTVLDDRDRVVSNPGGCEPSIEANGCSRCFRTSRCSGIAMTSAWIRQAISMCASGAAGRFIPISFIGNADDGREEFCQWHP